MSIVPKPVGIPLKLSEQELSLRHIAYIFLTAAAVYPVPFDLSFGSSLVETRVSNNASEAEQKRRYEHPTYEVFLEL